MAFSVILVQANQDCNGISVGEAVLWGYQVIEFFKTKKLHIQENRSTSFEKWHM
jgi:hypothetical protein